MREVTFPLKLFCCYAPGDALLCDELNKHLSELERKGLITIWDERKINPGDDRKQVYYSHLDDANIILLFISPDFIGSDDCINDLQRALRSQEQNQTILIPILLRPAYFENASFIKLQSLPRNGQPVTMWPNQDEALRGIAVAISEIISNHPSFGNAYLKVKQANEESYGEKKAELQILASSHQDFIQKLLENFTGRQEELDALRQQITALLPLGGYITVTGRAGQGKSSVIAKLVDEYGLQNVAHHFVPVNPGQNYSVRLMQNLIVYFVQKYQLSELYMGSENLSVLSDYFLKILREIEGKREIIFIDGLEQLEEMQTGIFEPKFLLDKPLPGIVFVLGISSESLLRPLESSVSHFEYQLPNLKRSDFTSILDRNHLQLGQEVAVKLYDAMQGNALYLDLSVQELKVRGTADIEFFSILFSHNPVNLFSLLLDRLEQSQKKWEEVLKPLLGILMVVQEPLDMQDIRQILNISEVRLQNGIKQLKNLIAENWQHRYSLFHLKFYEYLNQDKRFSAQEWHKKLVRWCKKGELATIWDNTDDVIEQNRRNYVQQYYIKHLFYAQEWQYLFQVLNEGQYGQEKIQRLALGMKVYIQDLDLGRYAAIQGNKNEQAQIAHLPSLWYYTLLRCSLAGKNYKYPLAAFRLLASIKRIHEALYLIEQLASPMLKASALLDLAMYIQTQQGDNLETQRILFRASVVIDMVEDTYEQAEILIELGKILAQIHHFEQAHSTWRKAEEAASAIEDEEQKDSILLKLGRVWIKSKQLEKAEQIIKNIRDSTRHAEALIDLLSVCDPQSKHIDSIARKVKWIIREISQSDQQTKMLRELVRALSHIEHWSEAEEEIRMIQDANQQLAAFRELGWTLARSELLERAETIWMQAKQVTDTPRHTIQRVMVLSELGQALTQAQQWERAKAVWEEANRLTQTLQKDKELHIQALLPLAKALTQTGWKKVEQPVNIIQDQGQQIEEVSLSQETKQLQEGYKSQTRELWRVMEEVIDGIEESEQKTEALYELINMLIQAREWYKVENLIMAIPDRIQQIEKCFNLGQALADQQEWERAKVVLLNAGSIISSFQNDEQKDLFRIKLAHKLVQAHQWEVAEPIISKIPKSDQKDDAYSVSAQTLIQLSHWSEAQKEISFIQDKEKQSRMLRQLMRRYVELHYWDEAEQVIDKIQDYEQQYEALRELARELSQANLWERAETVWMKIKRVIEIPQYLIQRVMVLSELGQALIQAKQQERAKAVWAEAERLTKTLFGSEQYVVALFEQLDGLLAVQDWEKSYDLLRIVPIEQKIEALFKLINALLQAQKIEDAQAFISEVQDNNNVVILINAMCKFY